MRGLYRVSPPLVHLRGRTVVCAVVRVGSAG